MLQQLQKGFCFYKMVAKTETIQHIAIEKDYQIHRHQNTKPVILKATHSVYVEFVIALFWLYNSTYTFLPEYTL